MSSEKKKVTGSGEGAIRFLADIGSTMKTLRTVALVAVVLTALVSLLAFYLSASMIGKAQDVIYVVENGTAQAATRALSDSERDKEVMSHLTMFHMLLYDAIPNIAIINERHALAMEMADESVWRYLKDLEESRYFSTIVDLNMSQQIQVDSMNVNIDVYPYRAEVFTSLTVMRASTIAVYFLRTECTLTNTPRSRENPAGLLVGDFYADKPVLLDRRQRSVGRR